MVASTVDLGGISGAGDVAGDFRGLALLMTGEKEMLAACLEAGGVTG